ncbi:hypothetical protein [Actinophytocola sp. NPDC049390]|uniref:hypothetical protein n=1 Tax=Actinophytocola sp. NPDC049390 TaxID=3363894 RepID=UPI0037AA8707
MALTADEIERRVTENDTARSTRRATAARRVGELARQHAAIAGQLADIERQLGELLAEADDVLTIDELARFTNLPAATLTQWRANHKPKRGTRRKPSSGGSRTQTSPVLPRSTPAPDPTTRPAEADAGGRGAGLLS